MRGSHLPRLGARQTAPRKPQCFGYNSVIISVFINGKIAERYRCNGKIVFCVKSTHRLLWEECYAGRHNINPLHSTNRLKCQGRTALRIILDISGGLCYLTGAVQAHCFYCFCLICLTFALFCRKCQAESGEGGATCHALRARQTAPRNSQYSVTTQCL